MYWKAAKAYTEYEFQEVMKSLARMHHDATTYLCETHSRLTYYDVDRVHQSPVTPWVEDKIVKHVQKSSNLEVHPITSDRYQVLGSGQYDTLVDLTKCTCICQKFQLSQIPCIYVIVVAKYIKLTTCIQWMHPYYSTTFYRIVYADAVNPLGDQSKWIHLEEPHVIHLPYMHRRHTGRLANKNKRLSQREVVEQLICSECHQPGHIRQNCRSPIPIPSSVPSSSGRKKKDGK
ncbi:uncharacterized protein LOC123196616 [Mangifera indica]|uniref:uncharacterized protein LOC123196616 n=1 Tax=Mangifera indica TaxID=29780 RepID=UPI001CFA89F7|nr:uncharacterized protein LOC123196616 [Mangifera indica]